MSYDFPSPTVSFPIWRNAGKIDGNSIVIRDTHVEVRQGGPCGEPVSFVPFSSKDELTSAIMNIAGFTNVVGHSIAKSIAEGFYENRWPSSHLA
jgi:hypothetical protein